MAEKILFPDDVVIETKLFKIGQDWEIPIPGFFSIATVRKIDSFDEFTDEECEEFIFLLRKLRKGMREILGVENVYFFQNEDTNSWFHLWVFPRLNWMKKFGTKIESVRPIMNYSLENMQNEKVFEEVRKYVKIMKEYMN